MRPDLIHRRKPIHTDPTPGAGPYFQAMTITEHSTRLHDAIQRLKACRTLLVTDDLLSGATVGCVIDMKNCASDLQALANDLANAQEAAAFGHRAAMERRATC